MGRGAGDRGEREGEKEGDMPLIIGEGEARVSAADALRCR